MLVCSLAPAPFFFLLLVLLHGGGVGGTVFPVPPRAVSCVGHDHTRASIIISFGVDVCFPLPLLSQVATWSGIV